MNFERENIQKSNQEEKESDENKNEFLEMSEKDQEIAREMESRIEKLQNFTPSEDVWEDCNKALELSGSDRMYEKVDRKSLSHKEVVAGLMGLREGWKSLVENPIESESPNLAKKLFFVDFPQEKINMIDRVISFHTSKLSGEEEKEYENIEAFSKALYNNISEDEYYEKIENIEGRGKNNDQELSAEDNALCTQWERETEILENLKISGDIAEDFNKIIGLLDEDKRFGKIDLKAKPASVLLKFVEMKTTWQNTLDFHSARPAQQKAKMREVYLDSMNRQNEKLKSFVDYYISKQEL